jgi:Reverse transcriptase (RNA-dependent DNA polymerase).
MNKDIEGSQCTIAWHVDDIKISHKKQSVLEDVLNHLQSIYGALTITRGNKHTFVGMDLEFKKGKVEISMQSYLNEAIDAFPEEIKQTVSSPAADHLYTVNPNGKKLPEDRRECFHHIVAKLLYVATRARPDLQPTISFLTSRCAKADEDDWKKLRRLLCYIKQTIDLKLTLRANAANVVMWWADAAFAVRDDFKSQSGRGMSLGTGMIQCKSNKQSTTENSSTTAELVSSSDALIMIIWTNNFLKAQGYPIKDTLLFQDNMSAIKLEKNGRQSSSKRTRHLNIKHFFIKDRVESGELNIKHCGTDDMVADYFTKPLQGEKFRRFRDLILGIKDIDSTDQIRSVLEKDFTRTNLNGREILNKPTSDEMSDTNGHELGRSPVE